MPTIYTSNNHHTHQDNQDNKKEPQLLSKKILSNIQSELENIKGSRFTGFSPFPKEIKFETQESKEKIILFLRRHFITNIPWIIVSFIMLILPILLSPFFNLNFMPARYQIITFILWYLITSAYILENYLSWYFNVYIITDERVIDVDFYSLIYKRISETKIEKIEDVTYSQGGIAQSFFDYGLVNIQTAGEITEFEFDAIPHPSKVAKVLNQLLLQEEQEKIEGRIS
jgi:hypothetical protein